MNKIAVEKHEIWISGLRLGKWMDDQPYMGQLNPAPNKIMEVRILAVSIEHSNFSWRKGTAHIAAKTVITENSKPTNHPLIHTNLFFSISNKCFLY